MGLNACAWVHVYPYGYGGQMSITDVISQKLSTLSF